MSDQGLLAAQADQVSSVNGWVLVESRLSEVVIMVNDFFCEFGRDLNLAQTRSSSVAPLPKKM